MTPDQARELLDGAAPGKWQWDETGNVAAVDGAGWEDVADYVSEDDAALIVAAPTMAAMIAGMREEWGIVAVYLGRHEVERWGFDTREDALDEASALDLDEARIVRRYVTTPEEA